MPIRSVITTGFGSTLPASLPAGLTPDFLARDRKGSASQPHRYDTRFRSQRQCTAGIPLLLATCRAGLKTEQQRVISPVPPASRKDARRRSSTTACSKNRLLTAFLRGSAKCPISNTLRPESGNRFQVPKGRNPGGSISKALPCIKYRRGGNFSVHRFYEVTLRALPSFV